MRWERLNAVKYAIDNRRIDLVVSTGTMLAWEQKKGGIVFFWSAVYVDLVVGARSLR